MSNSISSTPRRHSQSETDPETSGLVSSPSSSERDSTSEGDSGKPAKAPALKTREIRDTTPIMGAMDNLNADAPSQAAMTASSPTLTTGPTGKERRERYRQNRNLPVHQRDTNIRKVKTEKQSGASDIPQANKPGNRWDQFTKAVTADGELKLFGLSENDMSELIAWLRTSPDSVHSLEIVAGDIGDSGASALADVLRSNTMLTTLKLESSKIGEEGATALAEALKVNQTITTLGLNANPIRNGGAKALANALLGNTTLTTLELCLNRIEYEGVTALADLLRVNTTLTALYLSDNKIGNYGGAALVEALEVNKTLITLDLCRNQIGPHGAGALAKALQFNETLKVLKLHGNVIGDAGAEALASALSYHDSLNWLDLSVNQIGDDGAKALAESLRSNQKLTTIMLSGNQIGDVGTEALADALSDNATITSLTIFGNRFGNVGATALIKTLTLNTTLTALSSLGIPFNVDQMLQQEINNLLERNIRRKLLPYAEASLELIFNRSPALTNAGVPKDVIPLLAGQLSSDVLAAFGQEWQDAFRAPRPPVTTTTTNATVTTTTTTTTDSTIPTTLVTSPAALTADAASTPTSTTEPTATAATINALLSNPNPVMALSRWIDGHANPKAALNWVDPANGYTLLHYAVAAQQGAVVRSLLARGIDSKKADHNNQTAARLAQARADSSSSQTAAVIATLLQ